MRRNEGHKYLFLCADCFLQGSPLIQQVLIICLFNAVWIVVKFNLAKINGCIFPINQHIDLCTCMIDDARLAVIIYACLYAGYTEGSLDAVNMFDADAFKSLATSAFPRLRLTHGFPVFVG